MYKAYFKNTEIYFKNSSYKFIQKLTKEIEKECKGSYYRRKMIFLYPIDGEIYLCLTQGAYLLAFMIDLEDKIKEEIFNLHKNENLNQINILSSENCIIFEFDEDERAPYLENVIPTNFDKEIELTNITYKEKDHVFSTNIYKIFKEFNACYDIYYLKLIFETVNKIYGKDDLIIKRKNEKYSPLYFELPEKEFFALLMPIDTTD